MVGGSLWNVGETKDSILDRKRKPFGQFHKHVRCRELSGNWLMRLEKIGNWQRRLHNVIR